MSASLDAPVDPHFGRCLYFVIVDADSMEFDSFRNTTTSASNGAGVQAAQFVISKGVDALITGSIGSKAFSMLTSKGIDVLPFIKGSVADALRAYRENALEKLETPNSPGAHSLREQNHMYWKPRERTSSEDNHS